jgi:hypothetical protein
MESITLPAITVVSDVKDDIPQKAAPAGGSQLSVGGPAETNYSQDAVDLTETGIRGVVLPNQTIQPRNSGFASQFPPVSANAPAVPGSKANGQLSSTTAPAVNVSGAANATGSGSAAAAARAPIPSAAAEARLQKLNQVLENLGINPEQISYSERVSLLPLTNDPGALEQVVQGLQTAATTDDHEANGTKIQGAGGLPVAPQSSTASPDGQTSNAGQSNAGIDGSPGPGTGTSAARATNQSLINLASSPRNSTGGRINISV